ncbi:uncharacterized protein NPIL_181801 [Nephila pilipes]|uniref:Uncharacterized protein n=1 Tax=Nephila pilipes TaxID=299642 RepID=A0A8X6U097_NEPPI|nr:uncharacterized protein NPIL_181801 [Nephila pilipes]
MCECFPQDYKKPSIWVASMRGNVPPHAVCGGEAFGNVLYVCRVNHIGEIIIGKLLPCNGCCYIGWKGCEYAHYEYEVLCNPENAKLSWEWYCGQGELPKGSLQGGCSAEGECLYIGRKWHEGSIGIGTVVPSHRRLYASFWGKVYSYCEFEVLTCNFINF